MGADIDGEAAWDFFGNSVAMSGEGDRIVVGGVSNDGNGEFSGHARAFEYVSNNWEQIGSDIDGAAPFDFFGVSVAMSGDGNRIVVGGYRNYDGRGDESGHVRAF